MLGCIQKYGTVTPLGVGDVDTDLSLPPVCFSMPMLPGRGGTLCILQDSHPLPFVRLAREGRVWRVVGCGAPEQRRGVQRWRRWRAMLQESAVLSAVLDRTMFRFHRSTTWLDQAQRKAPRQLVRVKVRKQRQREDRSAQRKQRGEAEAGAGPH